MEERVPFNARQYLNERLRVAPFQHAMLGHGADSFSGGYFTKQASPFSLFTKNMTVRGYLGRLPDFIRGLSDVICFYYVCNDEDVQLRYGIHESAERFQEFKGQFDIMANRSVDRLEPRILLDHLSIDRVTQNEMLKDRLKFDFELAAGKVGTLMAALEASEIGNIKAYKRVIIKAGPETLRSIDGFHDVMGKFYSDAAVETRHIYPEIADKMRDAMGQAITKLETYIYNATPLERRGGRET